MTKEELQENLHIIFSDLLKAKEIVDLSISENLADNNGKYDYKCNFFIITIL